MVAAFYRVEVSEMEKIKQKDENRVLARSKNLQLENACTRSYKHGAKHFTGFLQNG